MRTSFDIPDPLFRHLKARAALEGRTLRDLVLDLVEKGLKSGEAVEAADTRQRMDARPLIGSGAPLPLVEGQFTHAALSSLADHDEDERARGQLAGR